MKFGEVEEEYRPRYTEQLLAQSKRFQVTIRQQIKGPDLSGFYRPELQALNAAQREFVTEQRRRLYIQNTWLRMAAIAYHEYLQKGRGALIVDFTSVRVSTPGTFDCNVQYHAAHEDTPAKLEAFNLTETIRQMRHYDPEREVLFIVLTSEGGFESYRVEQSPTPATSLLMVEALGAV